MAKTVTLGYRTVLFCALLMGALLWVPAAQAQETGTITGVVTDSTSGQTLPGVNVVIVGTQQGAATGADGEYTISGVEPGSYTVQASFVGFDPKRRSVDVAAGETANVDFALASAQVGLDEVVVIGYGTQERRDLTGSVASVQAEQISRIPTSSVTQALQGQAAGVQVTPSSGEPGSSAVVRIRGVGTTNDASPLYVVDGMLTDDIGFLNPQDIQSIEILKDASATAIYGSRGANGVILVSTKQGSYGQDTNYSFEAYYGLQEVMNPLDLVSAQQYAQLANELAANQGNDPLFENPQSVGPGTDWQDVALRTAPIQSYQLGAQGGTDRITYNFSGNYIGEDGIVENSTFDRVSVRLNSNFILSDSIELGQNLSFTRSDGVSAPGGIVSQIYRADPTVVPRNDEDDFNPGGFSSAGNPAATLFYSRNEYAENRLVGNLFVNAYFLEDFRFQTSFGLDYRRRESRNFTPTFFVSPQQRVERSSISVSDLERNSWLWENTLSYNNTFGDHEVEAVTGVTAQEFTQESLGGRRLGVPGESESLWYLGAGEEEGQSNFNSAFDWAMLSFLFRTNYNYLGRYLFTVTGRVDGSSRFGSENRYGFFPSLAAGWRLSDEPFMEDVDLFSNLKLRASWGKIGNDKIGAYPGIPVVAGNLNAVFGAPGSLAFGATPIELANPGVQWEETTQMDLAVELGFLDERLTAEVDYYRRATDGILVRVPIPDIVGVNVEPFVNAAEVLNTGFDFNLNWGDALGSDFDYQIGFVGSTVHNEVLSLGEGREEIPGANVGIVSEFATLTVPGQPIGAFYGYKVAGIYQTEEEIQNLPTPSQTVVPGDFRFEDLNNDGVINDEDRTFLGSPIPDFIYGINLSATWKGISLAADFNGQMGNEVFNAKKGVRLGAENFEESFLDRWTGPGTSNSEPRITSGGFNYRLSDWYLSDGSYFKLRNVRLGYALPAQWLGPLSVERAQIYVNGTNLFTFTEYEGYTPELGSENVFQSGFDTGEYPIPRTITVGVSTTF